MFLGRYYKNSITWSASNCIRKNFQNQFKIKLQFVFKQIYTSALVKNFGTKDNDSGWGDNLEKNGELQIMKKFIEKDLYPLTKDKTLLSMKHLISVDEIFQHHENFQEHYSGQAFAQALQKILMFQQTFPNENIKLFKKLQVLLNNMNKVIVNMDLNESIYCLLYVVRLGVDTNNTSTQKLFLKCYNCLDVEDEVPLSTLLKFSYIIKKRRGFYNFDICSKLIACVARHIENNGDCESLYAAAACLQNIISFVPDELIEKYKIKVEKNIPTKDFDNIATNRILIIATLFSYPKWSNMNHNLIRNLLIILLNRIEKMNTKEVELTCKLFQNNLEPANMLPKIFHMIENLNEDNLSIDLIAFAANFNKSHRKYLFEKSRKIVENISLTNNISKLSSSLYNLIRNLKVSDFHLCNLYWSKLLCVVKSDPQQQMDFLLAKHCFRYMFFNNNVGGTFRHLEFEKTLSRYAEEIILKNECEKNNRNFIILASFILAYGAGSKNKPYELPQLLITKLEGAEHTLSYYDCFHLSKGIQIASELMFKNDIPKNIFLKIVRIKIIIERRIKHFLGNEEIDLSKLNFIIRCLNNIKVSPSSEVYVTAIECYKSVCSKNINSRLIREIALNLLVSNYLISTIVSKSFDYVFKNRDFVLGDTVEKLLHTAYSLAYIPENEDVLHWSAEIIKRDFDFMTGSSIVKACLSLCYYRILPSELVQKIFTPEFIKKIEDEIELCYSKQTYPSRILNQVMELNRSVCIDFPEMQIPWFQQNYIEAQMSKNIKNPSKLFIEVEKVLLSVVKDKKRILLNQTTPYGYTIDFVVHLPNYQKKLGLKKSQLNEESKFAILILRQDAYCTNNNENLTGHEHMRVRHLEMLGFKVIHLSITDWNALYMNIPGAKVKYLKDLMQLL
ncbi:uncharacterized protein LOC129612451 [Condylostylus longicornis]|uniref:uncharacterized protein LOC129612451 n=1 Tax=Condylostylus longicornis TaxID=2530218 RepID=UPI00244E21FE|nr:uncharacterized protein LOC129612451 [Condylostylus longicornis]